MSIVALSSTAFGQQDKKTKEKKGGFEVGGYDNSRQEEKSTVTKRSVEIPAEAEPAPANEPAPESAVKQMEEMSGKSVPAQPAAKPQKEDQGNAYGKDKQGTEGKEFGQARSQDAKDKQKPKKNKSKGNRR